MTRAPSRSSCEIQLHMHHDRAVARAAGRTVSSVSVADSREREVISLWNRCEKGCSGVNDDKRARRIAERLAASTQELATPVVQGGRRGYGLTRKIERIGDGSGGD
ncbi:hypothetical protein C8J57DRAFT_1465840 [Mycena rebaudengoi]|nr:hypothetical protein C8J57DRAFT_1465840 [Mycena rebaudengoi]